MELRSLFYDGILLYDYCAQNNISFKELESRFARMRKNKKVEKYSDEELVDYIINTFYKKQTGNACKYYINGMSLPEFASEHGVLSISLRSAVREGLKKDPSASTIELAELFIERCKNKVSYTYDGYPLSIACKKLNISNIDVLRAFYEEHPDRDNMTEEEKNAAIKEIVDTFIKAGIAKNKNKGLKYEI